MFLQEDKIAATQNILRELCFQTIIYKSYEKYKLY